MLRMEGSNILIACMHRSEHCQTTYIYVLLVYLLKKTIAKPLERNVVYISIITLSHATTQDLE